MRFAQIGILLGVGLVGLCPAAAAAQEPGYLVFGAGNLPCAEYLRQLDAGSAAQASVSQSWIAGFITSAQVFGLLPDLSGRLEAEELMAWIERYCTEYPASDLFTASTELVLDLAERLRLP